MEKYEQQFNAIVDGLDERFVNTMWIKFYDIIGLASEVHSIHPSKLSEYLEKTLAIAEKDLAALQNPEILPNIKILINKNAENINAILRSELEHAGDIAKKTVPTDEAKHFSRYEGKNESEMSLGYVKKKADTRNGYTYSTGQETINGIPTGVKQVKNKSGKVLAEVRFTARGDNYEIRMDNYGIQKGAARKALADLMQEYPDKIFYWEAINEQSIKSYKHFCEEYPELAERIKFFNNSSNLDNYIDNFYNDTQKGVINEAGSNSGELTGRSGEDVSRTNKNSSGNINGQDTEYDMFGIPISSADRKGKFGSEKYGNDTRVTSDSNKYESKERTERGNETNTGRDVTEHQQGRNTESNTPEQTTATIKQQSQSIKSTQEADRLLDEVINSEDKQVITWEVNADNADDIYAKMIARGISNLAGLKEAFSKGDIDYVNMVVSKQLAAERIIGDLRSKLKSIPETDIAAQNEIIDSIAYLADVTHRLSAAYGRGLNAQKFVGRARSIFSLSSMEEMGLDKLSQLLSVDIKSLNFTRGIAAAREELYRKIAKYSEGDFLEEIFNDQSTAEAFDSYINTMLKNKETNPENIKKLLNAFSNPIRTKDVLNVINACTDDSCVGKAIRSLKANGGIESYITHNLLSNPGTTVANVLSGVMNSVYFPLTKVLGGYLSGSSMLKSEGWHQLKGLMDAMGDSWELAVQAFKTGEGQLINLSKAKPANVDTDIFTGFHAWDDPDWFHKMQNFHSFFTRLMGASDEFITQMNYRSIVKAQALARAEELAKVQGRAGDMAFISKTADKQFANAFNEIGQPLNVQAYVEARELLSL